MKYLSYSIPLVVVAALAWAFASPATAGLALGAGIAIACGLIALLCWLALRGARSELAQIRLAATEQVRQSENARAAAEAVIRRQRVEVEELQTQLQVEITRRDTAQRLALQSNFVDTLTQLPNRAKLQENLGSAIAGAERRNQGLSVLFVDIDDFKRVNDTLGHALGDELLKQVSERLSGVIQTSNAEFGTVETGQPAIGRAGGDEFVLTLIGTADHAQVSRVADRIAQIFRSPFVVSGCKVQTGVSIGIACYPRDGHYPDTLLKHADMAMHRVKEQGKASYQFFSHAMSLAASRRLAVENGLRKALEEQQFLIHYQPKVEVGTCRVIGAEALVRWRSPVHGLVSPANFIEVAEETGLIAHIGEWVLMHACEQQRAWRDAGLPAIQIAVNVSSMQFREDHLLTAVVKAIKRTGIEPKHLQLEVTENLFMKNMEAARNTLECIRGLGATVAIDDFGTGYSSFSYLRQLPVDGVKIDRSFVRDLGTKSDDREITRAILSLARTLGVKTVAEGVETPEQAELLKAMGCDEMQGYIFAPPVDAEMMGRILTAGSLPVETAAQRAKLFAPAQPAALDGEAVADAFAYDFHSEATLIAPMHTGT